MALPAKAMTPRFLYCIVCVCVCWGLIYEVNEPDKRERNKQEERDTRTSQANPRVTPGSRDPKRGNGASFKYDNYDWRRGRQAPNTPPGC